MYDGGNKDFSKLPLEQNKIYLNMDLEEERGNYSKIANSRLRRVTDWKVRNDSWT